jgi:integrase
MNVRQRYLAKGDLTYYGRFRFGGKQYLRNHGTTRKEQALKNLKALYDHVRNGRFAEMEALKERRGMATLGEVFTAYLAGALEIKPLTARHNVAALRVILSHTYDGNVDALRVSDLVPAVLQTYQQDVVKAAGTDLIAQDRARSTANSVWRQAKSVFTKKCRHLYTALQLPDITPFLTHALLKEGRPSYRVPPGDLVARTVEAGFRLRETDPAVHVAFLLAAGLGLRRDEILHARWSWITEENGRHFLGVQTTEDFRPKGRDDRKIPMEPAIFDALAQLRIPLLSTAAPDFILVASDKGKVFRRLSAWMRGLGWTTKKQAHELRKLYGSRVATEHGLFVAQRLLGHKDPGMTSRYYAGLTTIPDVRIFS